MLEIRSRLAARANERAWEAAQTGGTKRVSFAPVTKYDEGDVEYICGING